MNSDRFWPSCHPPRNIISHSYRETLPRTRTSQDSYSSRLACQNFSRIFGLADVYHLCPDAEDAQDAVLRGAQWRWQRGRQHWILSHSYLRCCVKDSQPILPSLWHTSTHASSFLSRTSSAAVPLIGSPRRAAMTADDIMTTASEQRSESHLQCCKSVGWDGKRHSSRILTWWIVKDKKKVVLTVYEVILDKLNIKILTCHSLSLWGNCLCSWTLCISGNISGWSIFYIPSFSNAASQFSR